MCVQHVVDLNDLAQMGHPGGIEDRSLYSMNTSEHKKEPMARIWLHKAVAPLSIPTILYRRCSALSRAIPETDSLGMCSLASVLIVRKDNSLEERSTVCPATMR